MAQDPDEDNVDAKIDEAQDDAADAKDRVAGAEEEKKALQDDTADKAREDADAEAAAAD